jgi:hypothetical protein
MDNKKKRFIVYKFASYHGTGWRTGNIVLALIFVLFRRIMWPTGEIILEDTANDEFLFRT